MTHQPSARIDVHDVQVTIGPFLVRVRSRLRGVSEHLATFYDGFPVTTAEASHVDIAIVDTPGLRRWFRPQVSAVINGARPYLPLPVALAGPTLEWSLNYYVGRYAHRWVVIHAAVVERYGVAIVMPADPGAGKSTLCAALTCAGWRLLSDEFALLDPSTGLLAPMPRPISLKDGSIALIRHRHPDVVIGPENVDVNGARFVHARPTVESIARAAEPARPGLILLPQYRAGARTTIERVTKAEALMKVGNQSFNYNYLGVAGYQCLVTLIERAACYRVEYSDLDDLFGRLTALVDEARAAHA